MSIAGGDAAALYQFANELRRRRARIDEASKRLGRLVEEAEWIGPDRDRFIADWNGSHLPSLMGVAQELGEAASKVNIAAQKQENASR